MTISEALQKKAQLVVEIARLETQIMENNSYKGRLPIFDIKALYKKLLTKKDNLIKLGEAIDIAQIPVKRVSLKLKYSQDTISVLESMPTKTDSGYSCVITHEEKKKMIDDIEKKISSYRKTIENFNLIEIFI